MLNEFKRSIRSSDSIRHIELKKRSWKYAINLEAARWEVISGYLCLPATFLITERRSIHGFIKVYEPPGSKDDEDIEEEGEEYDFRHVAKESHVPNQTVSLALRYKGTS